MLEASDGVGGRVRSDRVDGFVLDRGFQVLLTSYPEARAALDYHSLRLQRFDVGADVFVDGRLRTVRHPLRRPGDLPATALAPIGTLVDKARLGWLGVSCRSWPADGPAVAPGATDQTAASWFSAEGLSPEVVDRLLRPLFAGILVEGDLGTSSAMARFVWRSLAAAPCAVPAAGMQAIPDQLAARLPGGTIRLATAVTAVEPGRVRLEGGKGEVVADGPSAAALLPSLRDPGSVGVGCLWYSATHPPIESRAVVLDGEGRGPVNNLVVMSNVNPGCAPPGRALIAASVLDLPDDDDALDAQVRTQMERWFGVVAQRWDLLRVDRIAHAQPAQPPGTFAARPAPAQVAEGLFVCGDHRDHASIQGALVSGRRVAEAVLSGR